MEKTMNVKKLTKLSMYLTIALIIFTLESFLPPIAPIPGIKPGLANIIILIVIITENRRDAFMVFILRIVIASIFCGQAISFCYSFTGGLFSFAAMSVACYLIKTDKLWVISIFGAIAHNLGQIVAAIFITGTWQIAGYFFILFVSAVITGFFTGMAAQIILKRLNIILKKEECI